VSGLDGFDRIALEQKYASDDGGFDALFQQALVRLDREAPHGYAPQTPGRIAWGQLGDEQRERALDALLYAYFCDDRREAGLAEHYQDVTSQTSILHPDDLATLAGAAATTHGEVTVNADRLWRAVQELQLLVHRVNLLRGLATAAPVDPEALERLEADLRRELYGDGGEGQ
jgi:hypothetical protein